MASPGSCDECQSLTGASERHCTSTAPLFRMLSSFDFAHETRARATMPPSCSDICDGPLSTLKSNGACGCRNGLGRLVFGAASASTSSARS
ncbi:hypothetical protein D3C87_1066420 [compost metagenome]